MRIFIITLSLFLCFKPGVSQWIQVSDTFSNWIDGLEAFDGKLHIGGNFTGYNNQDAFFLCDYDGQNYNCQKNLIGGTGVYEFYILNNTLLAGGSFGSCGGLRNYNVISKSWSCSMIAAAPLLDLYFDGNDTFAVGTLPSQGHVVNLYSGTYTSFGNGFNAGFRTPGVHAINKYNGALIVGGHFETAGGKPIDNIAFWNGNSWDSLGAGIQGNYVFDLQEYQGKLYVAGDFYQVDGKPITGIAVWDGASWSDVGGSITNGQQIRRMEVIDGRLYVVGQFTEIGGIKANYVAYWNGNTWTALGNGLPGVGTAIEKYNGDLYAATYGFAGPAYATLMKFPGSVELDPGQKTEPKVSISPNPFSSQLNIKSFRRPAAISKIAISDRTGIKIIEQTFDHNPITLNVGHLKTGIYFILINFSDGSYQCEKLIKY